MKVQGETENYFKISHEDKKFFGIKLPLFELDNILLSPHIAGVTIEATIRMSKQAVQNVLDVFDNKVDPEVIINKQVL